MRLRGLLLAGALVAAMSRAPAAETVVSVIDPDGAAARCGAPIRVEMAADRLGVAPGRPGMRHFRLRVLPGDDPKAGTPAAPRMRFSLARGDYYDFTELDRPVLRYNHATVPVPQGIDPRYARGDYIHPLYGLDGEVLSDDYPKDHPHHRGVGWSWPVTRWKNEVRDIWAVSGVWSRPVARRHVAFGEVLAALEVENVWKWGDQDAIVREQVAIHAFRQGPAGRFVDIEVRLTGLADGVAIGGRPHAGYGGFGLRGAPANQRTITAHVDPKGADPRRSWLDYSGVFAGAKGPGGVAIFEHPGNPGYPSDLHQYPDCNYVMPAFPGQREVPLPKGQTLVLRHRLWIHAGVPEEKTLAEVWAAYARPPKVVLETRSLSQ
ncbi:MAG: PmoA family protein [Thermoguttaceae bacterium]|nr:PmoA family protein [Thermoguttaceae bacterium]